MKSPRPSAIPLHLRRRTSNWPFENRPTGSIVPSQESRNIGHGLWRRYPNGAIDIGYAKGIVQEALRKSNLGIALTEFEALAMSSVLGFKFQNLPESVVRVKAPLSNDEALLLRTAIENDYRLARQSMASSGLF